MSVHWPIESEYGKELARWNTPRNRVVVDSNGEPLRGWDGQFIKGMNCCGYEPFPRMLFKAQRLPSGQGSAGEIPPHPAYSISRDDYEQRMRYVEAFNRQCQRIVHDEAEERAALGQGWCRTTKEAEELWEREQEAIANAAAQAEFYAKKMSAQAQAEWEEANQEAGAEHVVDVVPAKRGPGRPPKAVMAVAPMDGTVPKPPKNKPWSNP